MTKYLGFILIICLILISCHPGPRPEDAVRFNDEVVMKQDTFYMHLDELVQMLNQETVHDAVITKYDKLLLFTEETKSFFEKLLPFDANDELRKASIDFFNSQALWLKNEMKLLLDLYALPPEKITLKEENQLDSIMQIIIMKDSMAAEHFISEQKKFADRYQITLRELD